MMILRRIITTVFVIAALLILCIFIGITLGLVSPNLIFDYLKTFPNKWEYLLVEVIILVIGIKILFSGITSSSSNTIKLSKTSDGDVEIAKTTLQEYVTDLIKDIYGIHSTRVKVKKVKDKIMVKVDTSVEPTVNFNEVAEKVNRIAKDSITAILGNDNVEVKTNFKQIKLEKIK
jgi:putative Mn2+ efflux pump MntP